MLLEELTVCWHLECECSPGLLSQKGCAGNRKVQRRDHQRMLNAFHASQGGMLQPGKEITKGRSIKSQVAGRKSVGINYLLCLSTQDFRAIRQSSQSQVPKIES